MDVNSFLQQMKIRCEAKAVEMAKLELSTWDTNHETQLTENFGFNSKSLQERKRQLLKSATK